jgi:hypothetical protein
MQPFTLLARVLVLVLVLVPSTVAQDVVWSTLEGPSPGGSFTSDVLPLENGAVIGVRGIFSSFTAQEWFLLGADGAPMGEAPMAPSIGQASDELLASDGAGGAFLLTSTLGDAYGSASLGLADAIVLHLDSSAQLIGVQRVGGTGRDVGRAIVADGAGGYFVAGETESGDFGTPTGAERDAFVARFDAAGSEQWVQREGLVGFPGHMNTLAPDGAGGVLCGGAFDDQSQAPVVPRGFVCGYDAGGAQQFFHSLYPTGGDIQGIARTPTGYVELNFSPFGGYLCVGRSVMGAPLWNVELEPTGSFLAFTSTLTRRSDGTYLIAGSYQAATTTAHMRGFDSNGAVLFDRSYVGANGARTSIGGLTADALGSVYVAGSTNLSPSGFDARGQVDRIVLDELGARGCVGQPNSTGAAARTRAVGSDLGSDNALTVFTGDLPPSSFGYYLCSQTQDFVAGAGGSQGDLCLGGAIGRLNRPGEVQVSTAAGRFHLRLDLTSLPSPTGSVSAMTGETWHFQAWYRDANPSATSNFSSSVALDLR